MGARRGELARQCRSYALSTRWGVRARLNLKELTGPTSGGACGFNSTQRAEPYQPLTWTRRTRDGPSVRRSPQGAACCRQLGREMLG